FGTLKEAGGVMSFKIWKTSGGMSLFALTAIACAADTGPSAGSSEANDATLDAGISDAPETSIDECGRVVVEASRRIAPVELIVAVDTSLSMGQEAAIVRDNLESLIERVSAAADFRVVIVAADQPQREVIPTLTDPVAARVQIVDVEVESNDAFRQILAAYDEFAPFLRPQSVVHVLVVSDDEADVLGETFRRRFETLLGRSFFFHAAVAEPQESSECLDYREELDAEGLARYTQDGQDQFFYCRPACEGPFGRATSQGRTYWDLAEATTGTRFSICSASWDPLFDALTESIVASSALPCTYALPDPPDGFVLSQDEIAVSLEQSGTERRVFGPAGSEGDCAAIADGIESQWYLDDNMDPSFLTLCPAVCQLVESGDPDTQRLDVILGCDPLLL
ncbi:MAG: hypothetical protein AAGF12_42875, partial [Myxococcota bacterium]